MRLSIHQVHFGCFHRLERVFLRVAFVAFALEPCLRRSRFDLSRVLENVRSLVCLHFGLLKLTFGALFVVDLHNLLLHILDFLVPLGDDVPGHDSRFEVRPSFCYGFD